MLAHYAGKMARPSHDLARTERPLEDLLSAGYSLAGTTAAAALGGILVGPPGAALGAVAGWTLEKVMGVAGEFALRHLAPRAKMRVGAVVILARDEISARIISGDEPREQLRDTSGGGRSPAEELVEAVLLTAADTYEERKLPHLAHLLAAIVFEPDLTPAHQNQVIAMAEELSYRQLVALSVYAEIQDPYRAPGFWGESTSFQEESSELRSVRIDVLGLFHRGLVEVSRRERTVRKEKPYRPPTGRRGTSQSWRPQHETVKEELPWPAIPGEVNLRTVRLTDDGRRLVRMMRLDQIPDADRQNLFLEHVLVPSEEDASGSN